MQPSKAAIKANPRCAKMQRCEVVRVDSPAFLVNSRQQACRYETADGKLLAAGYYLVLWPVGVSLSFHGRDPRYLGPLSTRAAACMLQTSAQDLGIVDLAEGENKTVPPLVSALPATGHWQPRHPTADLTLMAPSAQFACSGA